LERFGLRSDNKRFYDFIVYKKKIRNVNDLRDCGHWKNELIHANANLGLYETLSFNKLMEEHWLNVCKLSYPRVLNWPATYWRYSLEKRNFSSQIRMIQYYMLRVLEYGCAVFYKIISMVK
jgi:hypothetical protein